MLKQSVLECNNFIWHIFAENNQIVYLNVSKFNSAILFLDISVTYKNKLNEL